MANSCLRVENILKPSVAVGNVANPGVELVVNVTFVVSLALFEVETLVLPGAMLRQVLLLVAKLFLLLASRLIRNPVVSIAIVQIAYKVKLEV